MDKKKCAAEWQRALRTTGLGRLLALTTGSLMASGKAVPVNSRAEGGMNWMENESGEEIEKSIDKSFKKFHPEENEGDMDVPRGLREAVLLR